MDKKPLPVLESIRKSKLLYEISASTAPTLLSDVRSEDLPRSDFYCAVCGYWVTYELVREIQMEPSGIGATKTYEVWCKECQNYSLYTLQDKEYRDLSQVHFFTVLPAIKEKYPSVELSSSDQSLVTPLKKASADRKECGVCGYVFSVLIGKEIHGDLSGGYEEEEYHCPKCGNYTSYSRRWG